MFLNYWPRFKSEYISFAWWCSDTVLDDLNWTTFWIANLALPIFIMHWMDRVNSVLSGGQQRVARVWRWKGHIAFGAPPSHPLAPVPLLNLHLSSHPPPHRNYFHLSILKCTPEFFHTQRKELTKSWILEDCEWRIKRNHFKSLICERCFCT